MRVLYWTDLYYPHIGGIETFSADLIPALQARGHEVVLVTSMHDASAPHQEEIGGIPVYRFPSWEAIRTHDLRLLMTLRVNISRLKQEFAPDVVHLHFGATAYMHLQTRAAVDPPTLTTVHAIPASSLVANSLFHKVALASAAVNAVSARGERILADAFPELANRFSHVYYGLAAPEQKVSDIRTPSFEEPMILCLGRLAPQKGFDVALKAFAQAGPRIPRARLRIVGEGVEEEALRQLAADLGISDRVDFSGSVPPEAVFEVLNEASMILMPSRFEGLPLVALQAAFMQRPIISSDVDGLPELVIDGESGRVLKENDPVELAEAMIAMAQDPERAIAMGKAAGRQFDANFRFDRCVSRYEALYRSVAGNVTDADIPQSGASIERS